MTDFRGIAAKIRRAGGQINALIREMDELCSEIAQGVEHEVREDVCEQWWIYQGETLDVPIEWSVRIGEILHNLRSALDHLVWQLVLSNKQKPGSNNEFPICSDREKWDKPGDSQLKGVGEEAKKIIRGFQVFTGGRNLPFDVGVFRTLHKLCNFDKHRHLNLCAAFPAIPRQVEFGVEQWPSGAQKITGRVFYGSKIETGTVLCRIGTSVPLPGFRPFEVIICFDLPEPVLDEAELLSSTAVPNTLRECLDAVREADRRLRAASGQRERDGHLMVPGATKEEIA